MSQAIDTRRAESTDTGAGTVPLPEAKKIVAAALGRWHLPSTEAARKVHDRMQSAFPDQAATKTFWHDAASQGFKQFFTWGHDHDFGHGVSRAGAMKNRHAEIAAETIALGFLPADLRGREVLDIGCWSGGDALILAGLGARVTALEEHPISSAAARRLCRELGTDVKVLKTSLYRDRKKWAQSFDLVYTMGVVYHVTDPLLFLRIGFAYLRPGGRLILETKAHEGEDSLCGYSGTTVKGWNWYAPSAEALRRWLLDAGFAEAEVQRRPSGRLLACGIKHGPGALPESAGFSRPGSWLEGET